MIFISFNQIPSKQIRSSFGNNQFGRNTGCIFFEKRIYHFKGKNMPGINVKCIGQLEQNDDDDNDKLQ